MASDNEKMKALKEQFELDFPDFDLPEEEEREPGEWGGAVRGFGDEPAFRAPLGAKELSQRAWEQGRAPGLDPDVWKANWRESVQEPLEDWWEKPRHQKFMDVLTAATDIAQPGKGAGVKAAGVFMHPNLMRKVASAKRLGRGADVKLLEQVAKREEPLRKAAANWLTQARGTIYKKNTPLGDTMRKIGYAPGKESSLVLSMDPSAPIKASSVTGSYIKMGGHKLAKQDPAAAMHILGHEAGHPLYTRARALARLGDKNAIKVVEALEGAVMAGKGWRRPGGVMGKTLGAATKPGRSIPESGVVKKAIDKPHPRRTLREEVGVGPSAAELTEYRAELRMGERIADLLSELVTFKGQQGLNPRQREFLSAIMDFK